ncbi:MAG TPA: hypothetical protein VFH48_14740 [Chloroflexota bacterium]|nr:hypothetical protein [Chloroflexota bacterium]
MTDREFWVEVHRGLAHVLRGFGAISVAIARRYALGTKETASTDAQR